MTPIDSIAAAAGLDRDKAEAAVGAILAALTMSVRREVFAPVQKLFPDSDQLITRAAPAPSGGRTGELFAIVSELRTPAGAAKVAAQLRRAGLAAEEVPKVADAFLAEVRKSAGDQAVDTLLAAAPGLKGIVA